jgi:hypothetical protein
MKINAKIFVVALWVIALGLLWQAANNFETKNATGQCVDFPIGAYNCNSNSLLPNNSETITTGGGKIRWVALLGTI